MERLADHVNRAELTIGFDFCPLDAGSEENNRNLGGLGAFLDMLEGLGPVEFRHHDIKDDEIRQFLCRKRDGFPAVFAKNDFMPAHHLEGEGDDPADIGFVFGAEDFQFLFHEPGSSLFWNQD